MGRRLARSEVPEHLTWDLTDIFPDDAAWAGALAEVEGQFAAVTEYEGGRLGEGPQALYECLGGAVEAVSKRLGGQVRGGYASLKQSADGTDPANQEAVGAGISPGRPVRGGHLFHPFRSFGFTRGHGGEIYGARTAPKRV